MNSTRYSLPIKKRKVKSTEDFAYDEDFVIRKKYKIAEEVLSSDVTPSSGVFSNNRQEETSFFQRHGNLAIDQQASTIHPFYPQNIFYTGNVQFCGLMSDQVLFPIMTRENRPIAELHNASLEKKKESKPQVFNKWWKTRFQELVDFKKQHDHCHVPQRYLPNKSLGKWVHKQRQEFRKLKCGQPSSLTPERIEALKSIGFQCTPNNKAEALWQTRYKELKHYKAIHGNCRVPQNYGPNKALGKWVHRQRHEFKKMLDKKSSAMSKSRFEALVSIDFYWNAKELLWKRRLDDLTKFKNKHGHCNVKPDGPTKSLGLWLIRQRHCLNRNTKKELSKQFYERKKILESMGVNFSPFQNEE